MMNRLHKRRLFLFVLVTSDYAKHKQKTIRLDEAFQVDCKVPYSTKYCHIKAPNGTIYPTNNQYKTYLGECILKITKSVASDNGTWVCSFARENGHPDEEIYFDVTSNENNSSMPNHTFVFFFR